MSSKITKTLKDVTESLLLAGNTLLVNNLKNKNDQFFTEHATFVMRSLYCDFASSSTKKIAVKMRIYKGDRHILIQLNF